MKKQKIFPYIFIAVLFSITWWFSAKGLQRLQKVKGISTTLSSSEIISLTNLERTKLHIPPLQPNKYLSDAAQSKVEDMFDRDYFDHLDVDGNGSWNIIESQGYQYLHAGENLARNFNSAGSLINAWIKSDAHRINLLSKNYTDIGVAVLERNGQVYVVQILATPLPLGYGDSPQSGGNFSFSHPLSGSGNLGSNTNLTTISFIMSLLVFLVGYRSLSKVTYKHLKFKIPDIKYWHRK